MGKTRNRSRRPSRRRMRKKVSVLTRDKIDYVDYKDINLLRRFISDRAKIRTRKITGNNEQQQRAVALAIKNAREMALLPYENRVTSQRRLLDGDRFGMGGPEGAGAGAPPAKEPTVGDSAADSAATPDSTAAASGVGASPDAVPVVPDAVVPDAAPAAPDMAVPDAAPAAPDMAVPDAAPAAPDMAVPDAAPAAPDVAVPDAAPAAPGNQEVQQ